LAGEAVEVLFLTQTDARGASVRLRVYQFLDPLARLGIRAEVWPLPLGMATSRSRFLRGALHGLHAARRIADVPRVARFDAVVIQRDLIAHLVPWIEEAMARVNPRIVLDIDDPIHLEPPTRPPAWPFRLFWDRNKLHRLVPLAREVIVANRVLREEVASLGVPVSVVPTSVDTARWTPAKTPRGDRWVIGWIGSPWTTPSLEIVAPALRALAEEIPCVLRAVGADRSLKERMKQLAPGLPVEVLPWREEEEVACVRAFDVGIMPLSDDPWSRGKSATKLLQYMACGVPALASPVGANCDVVKHGVNGLLAEDTSAWVRALRRLANDEALAERLGREGRATVESEYSVEVSAPKLAWVIRAVGAGRRSERRC
jgi:glycosyltransferase involved in cell wall biosynthesis